MRPILVCSLFAPALALLRDEQKLNCTVIPPRSLFQHTVQTLDESPDPSHHCMLTRTGLDQRLVDASHAIC